MTTRGPDPFYDALDLHMRVKNLRALLELQRWQIEVLNERLYSSEPGGVAARRLLAIKQSEEWGAASHPPSRLRKTERKSE